MDEIAEQLQIAVADRYTLERELGRGGMAIVYLARDLKHDRAVAVKVLRPELGALLGAERFLREIKTVAGLQHPHILPLYDSGEAGGTLYYVMPFVSGESLSDRLRRERQLPIKEALRITREVADALHYAHAKDIVHRDIKPANILLSGSHAVVTDFGIARAIHASGGEQWETLTESGVALGTPAYMSPEQTAGERELDARSDIYSLGCVLFEMLTGEPPFSGPDGQVMLGRRFSDPPPSARAVRAEVPEVVDQALTVALASGPADRFGNALDFIDAIWGDREYVQHVTGRQRLRHERSGRSERSRRLLMRGGAAAAVLAVIAVIGVLATRGGGIDSLGNALFPGRTATDSVSLPAVPPPPAAPSSASARPTEPPATTPSTPPPVRVTAAPPTNRDTSPATPERPRAPVARPPAQVPRDSRATERARNEERFRALREAALVERAKVLQEGARISELAPGDSAIARADEHVRRGRFSDAAGELARASAAWTRAEQLARVRQTPAEPPVRAPEPAAPPPPVVDSPSPERREAEARAAIQSLLAAYANAIESRDASAIRRVYPTLTDAQARDWQIFFRSVRNVSVALSFTQLRIDGGTAEGRVTGSYSFENTTTRRMETQPVQFQASLRREDRGWQFTAIR